MCLCIDKGAITIFNGSIEWLICLGRGSNTGLRRHGADTLPIEYRCRTGPTVKCNNQRRDP